jgi:two-component system sensor histidine kinase HydH
LNHPITSPLVAGTARSWARAALVATVLATGTALLAASWSSWRGVRVAEQALVEAQAEHQIRALWELRRDEPATDAALSAFLESRLEEGLTHVAIWTVEGTRVASAGTPLGNAEDLPRDPHRPPGHELTRLPGGRVRAFATAPPAPGGRRGGPPPQDRRHQGSASTEPAPPRNVPDSVDRWAGDPPPPGGPGGPPPRGAHASEVRVVEFDPAVATALASRATLVLVLGTLATALPIGGAALTWHLQRAREAAEQDLAEQRRIGDLGGMSALVAHELRNPLASLKGHAQLLLEKLPTGSDASRQAERVVAESQRLERLAISLLDFVRAGRIERQPVDPAAVLRAAAEDVGRERVVLDVASAPPRWDLDAVRIRQALANLIENAIQASRPEARVEATARTEDGRMVFRVRDHGLGLPADLGRTIFEPFVTTRTTGTGLGLAVTRRIAETHGGFVQGANHGDGGAVFEIILPAAE